MRPFLCALLFALGVNAQPAKFLPLDDFVRDWQISKQFTLAVAEKMPAEYYDFKATPEEMTFGDQMIHLGGSLLFIFANIAGEPPAYVGRPNKITKKLALDLLNQGFDYVIKLLPKLTDEQLNKASFKVDFEGRPTPQINGRDMIMNMFVHVAHHRAQCEVYLRLKGIAPPIYTF
ncbi:MAG TPA: DinB family protein [Bryobacteraceae bacterium]|jgi:uncharacterized damage-inducible protein DinB|nr:DinB family protein [Bryobacteraceae bacterium]